MEPIPFFDIFSNCFEKPIWLLICDSIFEEKKTSELKNVGVSVFKDTESITVSAIKME